jgi:hypothetical protein
MRVYPDVSEIIEQKTRLRRYLAALPFEEKIALLLRMQERRRAIKEAVLVKKSETPTNSDPLTRRDIDQ